MSTTTTPLSTISLFYKSGSSDKEYHLAIKGDDASGYQVEYRYGKRGSKLKTAFKNKVPVDLATAQKIFDDKTQEQMNEGYTTGEEGTPYVGTENAGKVSGIHPQLLNFIEEEEVQKYLNDDDWVMQEKKDGVRQMIRKCKEVVEGINKKGLIVSLPQTVADAVSIACGVADATLDGELVGEVYWMFDLLSISIHAYTNKSYKERLEAISEWFINEMDNVGSDHFRFVPSAVGKASKKALYTKLKKENAEGVVFKKLDSFYKPGRPASGGTQIKFKFTAEATVRVRALNDKNSFQMEMLNKGDWVYVGDCTYFPTKYIPKPGDTVEVRYLYAYQGGSLFQPVLKELRTDVDSGDCIMGQLKYKQGSTEDDEA